MDERKLHKFYNKRGNQYLAKNKVEKAIKNYNLAIEHNRYYAEPYHNRRIACSMSNNNNTTDGANIDVMSNLVSRLSVSKPNLFFVLSTINYKPELEMDYESSDEEINDSDEKFISELKDFPFIIGKTLPDITEVCMTASETQTTLGERKNPDNNAQSYFNKLSSGGFEIGDKEKMTSVAVSLCNNRMKSLSSRKNASLFEKSSINTNIRHEQFDCFWHCQWYTRGRKRKIASYAEVRSLYKKMKKYDKKYNLSQARKVLEKEEGNFERNPQNIPYQRLREHAKNHDRTKMLVKEFRRQNPTADIYLHIGDSDVISFNGVFSAYMRIREGCFLAPTCMTTGYEYPPDLKDGPVYQRLSHLLRMIRIVTALNLPLGVYYPEPNMCVLVPDGFDTVPESFVNPKKDPNRLESPILLINIQIHRQNATFIFSEKYPIITESPERTKKYKVPRTGEVVEIRWSPGFRGGHPHTKGDKRNFSKVSQSDCQPLKYYKNLLINYSGVFEDPYPHDAYSFRQNGEKRNGHEQRMHIISQLDKAEDDSPDSEALIEALRKRITKENIVEGIILSLREKKRYVEFFDSEYEITEEELMVLDIAEKAGIDLKSISTIQRLTLASEPLLELIQGEDPERPIDDLLELDESTLVSIRDHIVDDPEMINILRDDWGDFMEASMEWDTDVALERYAEDPLHLKFMIDATGYVYENSEDDDIVSFAVAQKEYDVDFDWIISELGEGTMCEDFKVRMGYYELDEDYEDDNPADEEYYY